VANPSVTLDPGRTPGSGTSAVIPVWQRARASAAGTSCTIVGGYDWSGGVDCSSLVRQTTPATGSFAVAFSAAADDAHMVGALVTRPPPAAARDTARDARDLR